MDIKEIKILSIAELNHLLEDLRKKLDDLKFKATQKQLKNIREIRVVKKDIARILMTLKERSKAENKK
ncbi:MAG: 50S ribosomal protein L29 [Patescibacteria group bacterium]